MTIERILNTIKQPVFFSLLVASAACLFMAPLAQSAEESFEVVYALKAFNSNEEGVIQESLKEGTKFNEKSLAVDIHGKVILKRTGPHGETGYLEIFSNSLADVTNDHIVLKTGTIAGHNVADVNIETLHLTVPVMGNNHLLVHSKTEDYVGLTQSSIPLTVFSKHGNQVDLQPSQSAFYKNGKDASFKGNFHTPDKIQATLKHLSDYSKNSAISENAKVPFLTVIKHDGVLIANLSDEEDRDYRDAVIGEVFSLSSRKTPVLAKLTKKDSAFVFKINDQNGVKQHKVEGEMLMRHYFELAPAKSTSSPGSPQGEQESMTQENILGIAKFEISKKNESEKNKNTNKDDGDNDGKKASTDNPNSNNLPNAAEDSDDNPTTEGDIDPSNPREPEGEDVSNDQEPEKEDPKE